jgi:hypothetical protein
MANGRGYRPHVCRRCGGIEDDVGQISFRHLCEPCAIDKQTQAAVQLHDKRGPVFDRWAQRMREVIGDVPETPADQRVPIVE